ncbi:hypothetical protein Q1695_000219 [Nippostrongylus brasiliensis]|nr:hypothetical protein Q1695_000219 [Nippostrongylus brasiliensis]
MIRSVLCIVVIFASRSSDFYVHSCIATVSPDEVIIAPIPGRPGEVEIITIPGSSGSGLSGSGSPGAPVIANDTPGRVNNADCIANCPPIYRDNCYGTVKMICATGVQANSMVTTTGTECRQTWTCPAGTQPYYYDYSSIPIDYPPGGYAQCYPPPRNNWYLPDGITQIQAVSCESPT